ncbi:hypothetical protein NX059_001220 [Plenodomus lindquistii]|nr:hypothetical protein NX059_001220 [Plenodomus lindquistii]
MSQPSTPYNGGILDPFDAIHNHQQQQQLLSREELEDLFSSGGSDQPLYSSNNTEVFDDLDFSFDDGSLARLNSSNTSTISTPDFSTYSFGNAAQAYPTPEPNSPHPYPLDFKQSSSGFQIGQPSLLNNRPPYPRSNTTTPHLHPAQPYIRRRSLSQGDADRIAAANTISNPTFVRLQAPRARSTTPEEKRRGAPYAQHGRSASQGPGPRGRPMKQPTTPYGRNGSPLVGGMFSTPIGTPLDDLMEVEDSGCSGSGSSSSRSSYHAPGPAGPSIHTRDSSPIIQHMTRPEDLARSRQIIQIGAMAMRPSTNLDPNLPGTPAVAHHECILKKLDDIEFYLSQDNGHNPDALRGCRMIREALANRMEMDQIILDSKDEVESDTLDAPSTVYSEMDCGFMGNGDDDNELMKLLMQESGRAGSAEDSD